MAVSKRIVLHFPKVVVDKPIIYRLVKDYDLVINILKANISPDEVGMLVLELSGSKGNYDKGLHYLADLGVRIQPLSQDIRWIEERCTQCGACLGFCPTHALQMDPATRRVSFVEEKCVACEACVKPCPSRAIEVEW